MKSDQGFLNRILFAAFLVRLVFIGMAYYTSGEEIFFSPDSLSYFQSAQGFLETGIFSQDGVPEIVRTPGFPFLIMIATFFGFPLAGTLILQVILSVLTVKVLYHVSREIGLSEKISRRAAWLYVFEPLSIIYCSQLLSETFFTATLLLGMLTLIRALGQKKSLWLVGGVLSLLVLIRPIALGLPVAFVVSLLWFKRTENFRNNLMCCVVLLLPVTCCVSLWTYRNHVNSGLATFSAISDVNLYRYHASGVEAKKSKESMTVVQARFDRDLTAMTFDPPSERFSWMREHALETIESAPRIFYTNYLSGIFRTVVDPETTSLLKMFGKYQSSGLLNRSIDEGIVTLILKLIDEIPLLFWWTATLGLILGLMWILSLRGVLFVGSTKIIFITVIFYFVALSGGPNAHGRFRHPIMPILCLLAACGISSSKTNRVASNRIK